MGVILLIKEGCNVVVCLYYSDKLIIITMAGWYSIVTYIHIDDTTIEVITLNIRIAVCVCVCVCVCVYRDLLTCLPVWWAINYISGGQPPATHLPQPH